LPFAVWTAGAVRRPSAACAHEGRWLLAGMMWLSLVMSASAESLETENVESDADAVSDSDVSQETRHSGEKKADLRSGGRTNLWIGIRLQTRFDGYPSQNPSATDLRPERDSKLDLNRGCLKGTGPLGAEWLDVYFENDPPGNYLLDLRAALKLGDHLFLHVVQWKSDFNRGALIFRTGGR